MEETFLVIPDEEIRRAQSKRSIFNSLVQRISKSLFESLSMQNSNYAVIVTEQLGYTYPYPAKRDCIFTAASEIMKIRISFLMF